MYTTMLETSERTSLITFVLKSRLSESAKLRMKQSYSTTTRFRSGRRNYRLQRGRSSIWTLSVYTGGQRSDSGRGSARGHTTHFRRTQKLERFFITIIAVINIM